MKTYVFSSTMSVEAENEEEATRKFLLDFHEFVREAEMEEVIWIWSMLEWNMLVRTLTFLRSTIITGIRTTLT